MSLIDYISKWDPLVISGTIVLGALLAGLLVNALIFNILGRFAKSEGDTTYNLFLKYWKAPTALGFVLVFYNLFKPFTLFSPMLDIFVRQLSSILLIVTLTWFAVRTVYLYRDSYLSHWDYKEAQKNIDMRRMTTQLKIITRIVIILVYTVGISLVLMTFPAIQKVGISLLASAGLIGLIVGFAAQKSIANLLVGIQIAFAQPIRIGDTVVVEGEYGTIEEITLTFVIVKTWDKRRLVVPMNYFLENTFENWTRVSADLLGKVSLYTDFNVKVGAVRGELTRIISESGLWDGVTAIVQIADARENTMEIRAIVSASNATKLYDLRCLIREELIVFLNREFPGSLATTRVSLAKEI